jgi:hypothetical protein
MWVLLCVMEFPIRFKQNFLLSFGFLICLPQLMFCPYVSGACLSPTFKLRDRFGGNMFMHLPCLMLQTLPNLTQFQTYAIRKKNKEFEITFLKHQISALQQRKHNEMKVAAAYCWAITQAAGWSCCR